MRKIVCTSCNYAGKPGKKKRGSGKIEAVTWAFFPFGIPYALWRMLTKTKVCNQCRKDTVVDAESPVGVRLIEKIDEDLVASIVGEKPLAMAQPRPIPSASSISPAITPAPKPTRAPNPNYDPNW